MRIMFLMGAASIFAATMPAHATFTTYTNKAAWQAAAGSYTTITFQELPVGTNIVDSYSSLGVHFTDGIDLVYQSGNFVTDGVGLNGAFDSTTLQFEAGVHSIAVDYPGSVKFKLYSGDQLIYTSPTFFGAQTGNFGGVVSDNSFDKVVISDSGLFIDNLYFGPPVPGPGALALLSVGGLMMRSRRRR